jgi:hypothetical protein
MFGVGVDMLSDMEIIAMATPAITLAFVVGVVYVEDVLVDLLTDALAVIISAVVCVIDAVDLLADENANRLAAVITPLEFTLPAP